MARTSSPLRSAHATTDVNACSRNSQLSTIPFFPRLPLPTSNCGLTSSTICACGAAILAIMGITYVKEMNDTSETIISGRYGKSSTYTSRILTPLISIIRSSYAIFGSNCPWPTSNAMTCAASLRNNTSQKPPVDAPISKQCNPCAERNPASANRSNAPTSLYAPLET